MCLAPVLSQRPPLFTPPSSPHFLPSFLSKKSAQNFLNSRQIFSPQHETHLSLPVTSFMTGTQSKTLGNVHRIN